MGDELLRFSKIKCRIFWTFVGVKLFKGIKVKFTPDQAMKAQRGGRGRALLFL